MAILDFQRINTFEKFEKYLKKTYAKTIEFKLSYPTNQKPPQIELERLEVKKNKRRKGYGTSFLCDLCAFSDYHKFEIHLIASPLEKEISDENLKNFYRSFGFRLIPKSYCAMRRLCSK